MSHLKFRHSLFQIPRTKTPLHGLIILDIDTTKIFAIITKKMKFDKFSAEK